MEQLIIRDARENEYAMQAITLAAYQQYATNMPPPMWEGYQENMVQTVGTVGSFEHIVAIATTTIIGSVLLSLHPENANPAGATEAIGPIVPEVRLLAVAPSARGQGVGMALMEECTRRAKQSGALAIGLHTTDMMQDAIHLYERLGYQRVPEVDFHPTPDFVVKGYRLSLAAPLA